MMRSECLVWLVATIGAFVELSQSLDTKRPFWITQALAAELPTSGGSGTSAPVRLVIREGLFDLGSQHKTFVWIHQPVMFELLKGVSGPLHKNKLRGRIILPAGGYLDLVLNPADKYLRDGDRTAPRLYVAETTPLYLDPGRRPIGGALPDAFLPVYQILGDWVRLGLPGYLPDSTMENADLPIENRGGIALAFAQGRDLHAEPSRVRYLPRSDAWNVGPRDYTVLLRDRLDGMVFTTSLCGPLRVIERQPGGVLLAQLREGIEVRGWYRGPEPVGRDYGHCPTATMHSRGFETARSYGWYPSLPLRASPIPLLKSTPIKDEAGRKVGQIPAGAILEQRLSKGFSWFDVGPVSVGGFTDSVQVGNEPPVPPLQASPRPESNTPPREIVWRTAREPEELAKLFLAAFGQGPRTLWWPVRATLGRHTCDAHTFENPIRQPGIWTYNPQKETIQADGTHLFRGFTLIFHERTGVIIYSNPYYRTTSADWRPGDNDLGRSILGVILPMRIVDLDSSKLSLVESDLHGVYSYAEEDLAYWYFSKEACEKAQTPAFTLPTYGMRP